VKGDGGMRTEQQLINQISNINIAIDDCKSKIEEIKIKQPSKINEIISLQKDIKRHERDIEIIEWILGKDVYYPYWER